MLNNGLVIEGPSEASSGWRRRDWNAGRTDMLIRASRALFRVRRRKNRRRVGLRYLCGIMNNLRFRDPAGSCGSGLREVIAFLQLRALSRVPFAMPYAEVLPHKRTVAFREITPVYLLWSI